MSYWYFHLIFLLLFGDARRIVERLLESDDDQEAEKRISRFMSR